jgi:hypothetical protein
MKKLLFSVFLSTMILSSFASNNSDGDILEYFRIGFVPIEDKIILKWKSIDESIVSAYVLERSIDNLYFSQLSTVQPQGNNFEYQYVDGNIFKSSMRLFFYKVRIQLNDGTFKESEVMSLAPRISSTRQTWGSIKAIFQ